MRKIEFLNRSFRAEVVELLELCKEQGVKVVPYFTVRDPWTQAKLWRQSRSKTEIKRALRRLSDGGAPWLAEVVASVGPRYGKHVTNALPGMSWHQWGEAMDCFVANATGGAIWDGQHPGYKVYADTAVELELTAGYYWTNFFDPGHVQERSGSVKNLHALSEIDQAMRERFAMRSPELITPADYVPKDEEITPEEPVDQNDVDIMARTIFGEARGEADDGKIAVGWVVMNRVAYAQDRGGYWWGDSIRRVCLKPWQFSCWNSNDPNRSVIERVKSSNPVFNHCLEIAMQVITRQVPDPADEATHYYAEYISPPSWVNDATFVTQIGVHRFYKDIS
jgi:hypothetical protein